MVVLERLGVDIVAKRYRQAGSVFAVGVAAVAALDDAGAGVCRLYSLVECRGFCLGAFFGGGSGDVCLRDAAFLDGSVEDLGGGNTAFLRALGAYFVDTNLSV